MYLRDANLQPGEFIVYTGKPSAIYAAEITSVTPNELELAEGTPSEAFGLHLTDRWSLIARYSSYAAMQAAYPELLI